MKLYPRRGGNGYISCYLVPIGNREAERVGFVLSDGTRRELKKIIDEDAQTITISIDEGTEGQSKTP